MIRRAALTAMVMLASAGIAAAAAPALQDDRLPVAPLETIEARVSVLAEAGAKVARVDILWSSVALRRPAAAGNPDDPAYDWTRYDRIFAAMAARGIRPIVAVYSTPEWAARGTDPGRVWNAWAPRDPADYGAFLAAVATRYDGVRMLPTGRSPRLRHVEIWNEPNLDLFLRPQQENGRVVSPLIYADLVRAGYAALKSVRPEIIVVVGAGGPTSTNTPTAQSALRWIRALRAQRVPLDAYSQHFYPSALPWQRTRAVPAWSTLPQFLAEINRFPRGRRIPLFITEAGYTTQRTTYRTVRVSARNQARAVRAIYQLPLVRSPRIPVVVWFNLQDNPDWPAGLRTDSGQKKPSWFTFQSVARGARLPALFRPLP